MWSVVGWKGKEWPKMIKKKLCLSCLISQEPYIIWSSVMVHKCKGYLQGFLHFFQILIFRVISWVKGQKMAQNDKNSVCLNLYHSNFASYDVVFCTNWVKWWYLLQFLEHFYKILIFEVFRGMDKMAKNDS